MVRNRIAGIVCAIAWLGIFISAMAAPSSLAAGQQAVPADVALAVDATGSKVHYVVSSTLHTVHGEFSLKRGSIRLDPETGKASGEIVVDATSGESGNSGRDQRMHKEILESVRFPEIVFVPDRVIGAVALAGTSSVQVHGTFTLHGADHELTIPVQAEISGDHWTGKAVFDVPYINWGLKNPSNFLLKVGPTVKISLELTGSRKMNVGN
jgi:polyisoprenoid-binding protein YceI